MGALYGEFWIMDALEELLAETDMAREILQYESESESESSIVEIMWSRGRTGTLRAEGGSLVSR